MSEVVLKKAVAEAQFLEVGVVEQPRVDPPARLSQAVASIERTLTEYANWHHPKMWLRITGASRRKDSAQELALKARASVKWLTDQGRLVRKVKVSTRPTQGETERHEDQRYVKNAAQNGPWAVFIQLPTLPYETSPPPESNIQKISQMQKYL